MGRKATAHWHSRSHAWRTCAKAPGATKPRSVYFRSIPFGEVGSPNWHRAQAALAAYLASVGRTADPYPGGNRRRAEPVDPPAPSRAAAERIRARRLRRMGDGRRELDSPALGCHPPRSDHREAGPASDAQACAMMLQEWKRRAGFPA